MLQETTKPHDTMDEYYGNSIEILWIAMDTTWILYGLHSMDMDGYHGVAIKILR